MHIEIQHLKPFDGLPNARFPDYGRGVANFTALVDNQIYFYRATLRQRPDGSFYIVLKDGPEVVGRHCITLREGPMRQALTQAVVHAYQALTVSVSPAHPASTAAPIRFGVAA